MKKKVHEITKGEIIKVKKKEAKVVSIEIKEMPITRIVRTAVVSYSYKDDEDNDVSVFREIHLNGDEKIEVIPPSAWERLSKSKLWKILSGQWHAAPKAVNTKTAFDLPPFMKAHIAA